MKHVFTQMPVDPSLSEILIDEAMGSLGNGTAKFWLVCLRMDDKVKLNELGFVIAQNNVAKTEYAVFMTGQNEATVMFCFIDRQKMPLEKMKSLIAADQYAQASMADVMVSCSSGFDSAPIYNAMARYIDEMVVINPDDALGMPKGTPPLSIKTNRGASRVPVNPDLN